METPAVKGIHREKRAAGGHRVVTKEKRARLNESFGECVSADDNDFRNA
jgi:hypothetical protein